MFGIFFDNIIFCFTRFASDSKTEQKRSKGKEKTKEQYIEEY
jgi:hypothetical protein